MKSATYTRRIKNSREIVGVSTVTFGSKNEPTPWWSARSLRGQQCRRAAAVCRSGVRSRGRRNRARTREAVMHESAGVAEWHATAGAIASMCERIKRGRAYLRLVIPIAEGINGHNHAVLDADPLHEFIWAKVVSPNINVDQVIRIRIR